MIRKIISITALTISSTFSLLPNAFAEEPDCNNNSDASFKTSVNDAWLDGKLESALLFNQHLNSFDIDTEVKHDTAYLSGIVESSIDKDLAEKIAKSVDGIQKVENNLIVDRAKAKQKPANNSPDSSQRHGFRQVVSDATLTARIKSELLANSNTSGFDIDVDTHSGNITLTGKVSSDQEKDLAEQIAKNASKDGNVRNKLIVKK